MYETSGEAKVPGPTSPDQANEPNDNITIECVNPDSKGPLKQRLDATDATIVIAEETKTNELETDELKHWARRNGWKSIIVPCNAGETSQERSAGVGVFVRSGVGIGLGHIGGRPASFDARALVVKVECKAMQPIAIVATYLYHTEMWSQRNRDICSWVAEQLNAAAMPFVWGGDFNMQPQAFQRNGVCEQVKAALLAPQEGTCRIGDGKYSKIDYFLVSHAIKQGFSEATAILDATTPVHRPVQVKFEAGKVQAEKIRRRSCAPTEPTVKGPYDLSK